MFDLRMRQIQNCIQKMWFERIYLLPDKSNLIFVHFDPVRIDFKMKWFKILKYENYLAHQIEREVMVLN